MSTVVQLRQQLRREAEQATERSGEAEDPWVEVRTYCHTCP